MSKWVKTDEPNQFFVKKGPNRWVEYQNGSKHADFEEVSNNSNGKVILKKNDGVFVRLTNSRAFWGMDKNNIDNFICNGEWKNSCDSNSVRQKWTKSDVPDQFFVKKGPNRWVEYQNGSKCADFEEVSNNSNGKVILKKNDGVFVRLTNSRAFWGKDKNNIDNFICNGSWTNDAIRNPEARSDHQKNQSPVRNEKNKQMAKEKLELDRTMDNFYNNALKYIKDTKFSNALNEINQGLRLKPSDGRFLTAKSALEQLIQTMNAYVKLISESNALLAQQKYNDAKEKTDRALSTYVNVTNDINVLTLFQEAELDFAQFIRKGKTQIKDLNSIIEQDMQEDEEKKKKNRNNQDLNVDQSEENERAFRNILRCIRDMQFQAALDQVNLALKQTSNTNMEKLKTYKTLLNVINSNSNEFNAQMAEGNRQMAKKEYNQAKETYEQALETYLEILNNPNIIGMFREARLDQADYIQHGRSQVDQLIENINKNSKDDSFDDDMHKNALRAIRNDMNYEKALSFLKRISPSTNVRKEIECLEKVVNNRENYFNLISEGKDLEKRNKFKEAMDKYEEASKVYLEIETDATFIRLHDGDVTEYKKANKAQVHLEEAKSKLWNDRKDIDDPNFWDEVPPIG